MTIDKTGVFHYFGLHERFLQHASERPNGSNDGLNLTSENDGYALVGVLILQQSRRLKRAGVHVYLAWIPKGILAHHSTRVDISRTSNVAPSGVSEVAYIRVDAGMTSFSRSPG